MFENIRGDLRAHGGDWSAQGFWALLVYRFGRWRYGVRPPLLRKFLSLIYKILFKFIQIVTGIQLPCEVPIGRSFVIDHLSGIIISGYAKFGDDCRIRSGVVVGIRRIDERSAPVIGNNVDIGVGAKLLGAIRIGNNVLIGANALVRLGFEIQRIALRGWQGKLVDEQDLQERTRTRYVLQEGLWALLWALLRTFLVAPGRFFSALALAIRMGHRAERPLPYHLACLAEACRMLPWLKSFGATHVHAHFGTNSAEVVMLARALGGPSYSFTVHGPEEFDKPQFLGIGEKVRRSAFVVAISSHGRSQLYRWVEHAYWPKVKVVHCGLEPAFYNIAPVPPAVAPRLVSVGRLSAEKGQLLLVEAARRLTAKGIHFELVLIGDGEMRAELEALIAKHA